MSKRKSRTISFKNEGLLFSRNIEERCIFVKKSGERCKFKSLNFTFKEEDFPPFENKNIKESILSRELGYCKRHSLIEKCDFQTQDYFFRDVVGKDSRFPIETLKQEFFSKLKKTKEEILTNDEWETLTSIPTPLLNFFYSNESDHITNGDIVYYPPNEYIEEYVHSPRHGEAPIRVFSSEKYYFISPYKGTLFLIEKEDGREQGVDLSECNDDEISFNDNFARYLLLELFSSGESNEFIVKGNSFIIKRNGIYIDLKLNIEVNNGSIIKKFSKAKKEFSFSSDYKQIKTINQNFIFRDEIFSYTKINNILVVQTTREIFLFDCKGVSTLLFDEYTSIMDCVDIFKNQKLNLSFAKLIFSEILAEQTLKLYRFSLI